MALKGYVNDRYKPLSFVCFFGNKILCTFFILNWRLYIIPESHRQMLPSKVDSEEVLLVSGADVDKVD
jgi:hypothetical protein